MRSMRFYLLKNIVICVLFVTKFALADLPTDFAAGAGVISMGSDIGLSGQMNSPFLFFGNALTINAARISFRGSSYDLFEVGALTPILRAEHYGLYFKSMIEFFFAPQIARNNSGGIHYSFAGEAFRYKNFTFLIELGYSLHFSDVADKHPERPTFGSGLSFIIGPKFYLN